jgi:enoyl-CoA hydratase/carnithine racemase
LRDVQNPVARISTVIEDNIGWMIFDHPARDNAVTTEMIAALPGLLRGLNDNPDVRVIVLKGAGSRAFIAGGDISQFPAMQDSAAVGQAAKSGLAAMFECWAQCHKPVVAMIDGYCLGAGLLIALCADLRVASERSQFSIPAARIGIGYDYGAVDLLASAAGAANAAEILLLGNRFGARDAQRLGLLHRVVAGEALAAEIDGMAKTLAGNAPLTMKGIKASLRHFTNNRKDGDRAHIDAIVAACFQSEDFREGTRAFAEERAPKFTGR